MPALIDRLAATLSGRARLIHFRLLEITYHPPTLSQQGEPMPKYRVLMNENARYMDEGERSDHGVFANAEEAIAACKAMVDDELATMHRPGMGAKELYRLYVGFGPDPFVIPLNPSDPDIEFSAWSYAKERCKELVSRD